MLRSSTWVLTQEREPNNENSEEMKLLKCVSSWASERKKKYLHQSESEIIIAAYECRIFFILFVLFPIKEFQLSHNYADFVVLL